MVATSYAASPNIVCDHISGIEGQERKAIVQDDNALAKGQKPVMTGWLKLKMQAGSSDNVSDNCGNRANAFYSLLSTVSWPAFLSMWEFFPRGIFSAIYH